PRPPSPACLKTSKGSLSSTIKQINNFLINSTVDYVEIDNKISTLPLSILLVLKGGRASNQPASTSPARVIIAIRANEDSRAIAGCGRVVRNHAARLPLYCADQGGKLGSVN